MRLTRTDLLLLIAAFSTAMLLGATIDRVVSLPSRQELKVEGKR